MKNSIKNQIGSIALMSVLVISAVMLILVLGTSDNQISISYQQQNNSSGKYSYYIAEACLEEAIGAIRSDLDYSGGTMNFDDTGATCQMSVTGVTDKTIDITTVYDDYVQSYQGQISIITDGQANNINLLNWRKI